MFYFNLVSAIVIEVKCNGEKSVAIRSFHVGPTIMLFLTDSQNDMFNLCGHFFAKSLNFLFFFPFRQSVTQWFRNCVVKQAL